MIANEQDLIFSESTTVNVEEFVEEGPGEHIKKTTRTRVGLHRCNRHGVAIIANPSASRRC